MNSALIKPRSRSIPSGRKVAIDASMCLYQFLIAVRSEGSQLVSSDGETTRSAGYTLQWNPLKGHLPNQDEFRTLDQVPTSYKIIRPLK